MRISVFKHPYVVSFQSDGFANVLHSVIELDPNDFAMVVCDIPMKTEDDFEVLSLISSEIDATFLSALSLLWYDERSFC